MTETAFILPIILLSVVGIIDFGLAIYAYAAVSEASRAGDRYCIVHGSMATSP